MWRGSIAIKLAHGQVVIAKKADDTNDLDVESLRYEASFVVSFQELV